MTELMIEAERIPEPLFVPPRARSFCPSCCLGQRAETPNIPPLGYVLSPTSPKDPILITPEQTTAFTGQREGWRR